MNRPTSLSSNVHDQDREDRDPIRVVCAADGNYGPYAGITLSSILDSNRGENLRIHVLSDGISTVDVRRMSRMAQRGGAELVVHDIQQKLTEFPNIKHVGHYSRAICARLFLPDLLPANVGRVIYLDCDVICVSKLRELWRIGEDVGFLAAVRDVWVDRDTEYKRRLGMPADSSYYNSGVLLINLDAWRRHNVADRLLSFAFEGTQRRFVDQDAINFVLWKEITELPRRWNTLVTSPIPGEARTAIETAAIIHFASGVKPWHFGYGLWVGTGLAAFRRAKAGSPWRWKLPDFHVTRIKRKLRRLAAP